MQVLAYVNRVKDVDMPDFDIDMLTLEDIEANDVRCPDQEAAKLMYKGTSRSLVFTVHHAELADL